MKQQISDMELDQVVGGTVCVSQKRNRISFSTLKEGYDLKCTYKQASAFVFQMYSDAPDDIGEKAFDELVKKAFQEKGWI